MGPKELSDIRRKFRIINMARKQEMYLKPVGTLAYLGKTTINGRQTMKMRVKSLDQQ